MQDYIGFILLLRQIKHAAVPGNSKQLVIRIRIHMFLGLPDPDPLVRGMDPDPDPAPEPSIIMQN
jgi:hypothetical protein